MADTDPPQDVPVDERLAHLLHDLDVAGDTHTYPACRAAPAPDSPMPGAPAPDASPTSGGEPG